MALSKINTNSIADDAVTTAKVNPAQTDITSVGTLTSFASTGIDDNADATAVTISSDEDVSLGAGDLTISRAETDGTVRLNLSNTGSNGSSEYSEIKFNSTAGSTVTSIVQHRNNSGMNIGTTTNHPVSILQNNAAKLTTSSTGVTISGTSLTDRGDASAPGYSFSDDTDTGMFNVSNADLAFSVGGTERMRIDSDGFLDHFANHNGDLTCRFNATTTGTPYGLEVKFTQTAPDNTTSWAYNFTDTTTQRFRVYSDGDVVNHDNSYGASSDERIKQDIVDANSQWDDIKAIKVRNYKKKDDVAQYGEKAWTQIGVVAQEIEKVSPKLIKEHLPDASDIKISAEFGTLYTKDDEETQDAVLYTKDDEEVKNGSQKVGDIKTPSTKQIGDVKEIKDNVKRVSYSVLYMKAVKALQEAMTRIETLEAKVKTLEEA